MSIIATKRLILIALSPAQLNLCLRDRARLAMELNLTQVVDSLIDPPVDRAIRMKIERMADAPPEHHHWMTYWLIVVDGVGVGTVGYKGYPNPATEIGYGIDSQYQGKGYMTEAVHTLIAWAFQNPACQTITADKVLLDNFASQKVLKKNGMRMVKVTKAGQFWQVDRQSG